MLSGFHGENFLDRLGCQPDEKGAISRNGTQ
jgi:hypothetical protein